MYGIIDYDTKWVIGAIHQHRYKSECWVADKHQVLYHIFKCDSYVIKSNFYAGVSVRKSFVMLISDEQYDLLATECEKIMKAELLLNTTIGALVGSLPKPNIDDEVTEVEFE